MPISVNQHQQPPAEPPRTHLRADAHPFRPGRLERLGLLGRDDADGDDGHAGDDAPRDLGEESEAQYGDEHVHGRAQAAAPEGAEIAPTPSEPPSTAYKTWQGSEANSAVADLGTERPRQAIQGQN